MDTSDTAAELVAEYDSMYVDSAASKNDLRNLTRFSSFLSNHCSNAAASTLSNLGRVCPLMIIFDINSGFHLGVFHHHQRRGKVLLETQIDRS